MYKILKRSGHHLRRSNHTFFSAIRNNQVRNFVAVKISAKDVKVLRERSDAPMMECTKTLQHEDVEVFTRLFNTNNGKNNSNDNYNAYYESTDNLNIMKTVSLFSFVLMCNLLGMVPYSFTATSHFAITFGLALMVFIAVNIVLIQEHGIKALGFFMPPGCPMVLAPMLVAIEFIGHFFKF